MVSKLKNTKMGLIIFLLLTCFVSGSVLSDEEVIDDYDYLIITNNAFASSNLTSFATFIENNRGLKVKIIPFPDGYTNTQIKDSIKSYYFDRPQRLLYVLLLGSARRDGGVNDDKTDYWNDNSVPGFYHIDEWGYRTLYDNEYVSFDTTGLDFLKKDKSKKIYPRIIIGRLPIKSVSEIALYEQKLQTYEDKRIYDAVSNPDTAWHSDILFIVGDTARGIGTPKPGWVLNGMSKIQTNIIPSECDQTYFKMSDYTTLSARETAFNSSINAGRLMVVGMATGSNSMNYFDVIARPSFDANLDLTNTNKLPLVLASSCNTGQSDIESPVSQRSMVENLLVESSKGAIAVIGPSGNTAQLAVENFTNNILDSYFKNPTWSIGQLFASNKINGIRNLHEANSLDTYTMFTFYGDPSLVLYNDAWLKSDSGFNCTFEVNSPIPFQNNQQFIYGLQGDTAIIGLSTDPDARIIDDRVFKVSGNDVNLFPVSSYWTIFDLNLQINQKNRFLTFYSKIPIHPSGISKLNINGLLSSGGKLSDPDGPLKITDQYGDGIGASDRTALVSTDIHFYAFDLSLYDGQVIDKLLVEYHSSNSGGAYFSGFFDNISISATWGFTPSVDEINMSSNMYVNSTSTASIYADDFSDITFRGDQLSYAWSADAGYFTGSGSQVTYHSSGVAQANVEITCSVSDLGGHTVVKTKNILVEAAPGCPTFYVWNNNQYTKDNVLLTESEDNLRGSQQVIDLCPLTVNPDIVNGEIRIKITEEENEISYIDQVELIAIPHTLAKGEKIALNEKGELVAMGTPVAPFIANSPLGNDLTKNVLYKDGKIFDFYGSGELTLMFPNLDSMFNFSGRYGGLSKVLEGTPGGGINGPPPPDKGYYKTTISSEFPKKMRKNFIRVEVLKNGYGFQTVQKIFPRMKNTIPLISEITEHLIDNPMPVVKISWDDRFKADQIAFYPFRRIDRAKIIKNNTAINSDKVSYHSELLEQDNRKFVLTPGNEIDLTFKVPEFNNEKVQYLLKVTGYYETIKLENSKIKSANLIQNYPNPFNNSTEISLLITQKTEVELSVYNVLGQKVKSLYDGVAHPGRMHFSWDGRNEQNGEVSTGVYFYKLVTNDFTETKKMILLK